MATGSQTEYVDPPSRKDIDTQAAVNRRRMLTKAGTADTGANDRDA